MLLELKILPLLQSFLLEARPRLLLLLFEAADITKFKLMLDFLKLSLTFGYKLISNLWIIAELQDTFFVYSLVIGVQVLDLAGRPNLGRTSFCCDEILNLVVRRGNRGRTVLEGDTGLRR